MQLHCACSCARLLQAQKLTCSNKEPMHIMLTLYCFHVYGQLLCKVPAYVAVGRYLCWTACERYQPCCWPGLAHSWNWLPISCMFNIWMPMIASVDGQLICFCMLCMRCCWTPSPWMSLGAGCGFPALALSHVVTSFAGCGGTIVWISGYSILEF